MFFLKKSARLIKLPEFEMWVNPNDKGVCRGLIEAAEKFAKGEYPGPGREPEFNWIIRQEIGEICKTFQNREGRAVIYDLGANVGYNSLIIDGVCRTILPREKYAIFAIEPNPANAELLNKNIAHSNLNAQFCGCAISNQSREADFFVSDHSNLGALVKHEKTKKGIIGVNAYSLPDFAETFKTGQPNFIKMDIEGGEVEVLKGAREFLAGCKKPCEIIMEVHPPAYTSERSLEKELRFLLAAGWRGKYMTSAAVIQPDKFKEAGLKPFKEFHGSRHSRGLYKDFTSEQLIDFSCRPHIQEVPGRKASPKIVRAILIEKL